MKILTQNGNIINLNNFDEIRWRPFLDLLLKMVNNELPETYVIEAVKSEPGFFGPNLTIVELGKFQDKEKCLEIIKEINSLWAKGDINSYDIPRDPIEQYYA
jgi:hypothetical protein